MPLLPQGSAEAGNDAQGSYHRLPDEPDDSMSAETIRNDSTPAHDVSGGRQPPGNLNGDPICSSPTTSPTLGSSPTLASSPSLHGPLKRWSTGGASLLMTAEYSRGRQFRHQLWQFFLRLFLSGAILGLIYACFTFGEKAGILDRTQKHVFNAVYLGLSLLLGLNLVSSYKEMADVFRWTFAASNQYGGHTAREFDTILGMSSYQNCAKLLKYWFPKQKHFWIVFIWLFLGIGAQVTVALLGLVYEHESENAFIIQLGDINATDLGSFQPSAKTRKDIDIGLEYNAQNARSHSLGAGSEHALNFGEEDESMPPVPGPNPIDVVSKLFTDDRGRQSIQYKYYFRESFLPATRQIPIEMRTTRFITANARCTHSLITNGSVPGNIPPEFNPPPPISLYPFMVKEMKYKNQHEWLQYFAYPNTTLYSTPNLLMNASEQSGMIELHRTRNKGPYHEAPNCGARCSYVEVFRWTAESSEPGDYFFCNSTVSSVQDAGSQKKLDKNHEVSNTVAERAASAIARNDIWHDEAHAQSQSYFGYSAWRLWNVTGEEAISSVEDNIARFAIGSIALLDRTNSKMEIKGDQPQIGVRLEVRWHFVALIIVSLLLAQAIPAALVLYFCHNTFCRDSSFFTISRILQPIVELVDQYKHGRVTNQDAFWELFSDKKIRYAVNQDDEGRIVDIRICEDGFDQQMGAKLRNSKYYA